MLIAGTFAIVLPPEIVRSFRHGTVYLNVWPIRRGSLPILFWPLWALYVFFLFGAVGWVLALLRLLLAMCGVA